MAALNGLDAASSLRAQLTQLEQADLIRLASAVPDLEYLFRHALIHESAYHTLVRADRRRVHRAVGEVLEAALAGRQAPAELAPQLARHFEEAADYARAVRYYIVAGDAALEGYANAEAIAAYSRALTAAEQAAAGLLDSAAWQHLFEARGRALELNAQFPQALANYQAMEARGLALGQPRLALAGQVAAGQLYATITPLFDPPRAEQMAEAALSEARALRDEAAEAKILWNQLNLNRLIQRQARARAAGEQSLAIARRLGLKAQAAASVHDLVHVYAEMGLWPEMEQAAAEARQQWQALGNRAMLVDSLATAALYHGLAGQLAPALAEALEAHQQAQAIGNLWGQAYSIMNAVWPDWYTGHPDRAIESANECVRVGSVSATFTLVALAWKGFIYAELGDSDSGLEWTRQAAQAIGHLGGVGQYTVLGARLHLEQRAGHVAQAAAILETIDQNPHPPAIFEVDALLRARAEVALARGAADEALAAAQARVAVLRGRGLWLYVPEALCGLAQAWLLQGQPAQASAALAEALEQAQALGAVWVEWHVRYALGRLEMDSGNAAGGRRHWARARELVTSIADRIPTPALRQSFRARPEVRALGEG